MPVTINSILDSIDFAFIEDMKYKFDIRIDGYNEIHFVDPNTKDFGKCYGYIIFNDNNGRRVGMLKYYNGKDCEYTKENNQ